jgi:DNA-binding PadR family transcriptional regulator
MMIYKNRREAMDLARSNSTKYAILGVLDMKPSSGYDIKKFCDNSIAHFWSENYGHIYPVLKQMESDGWVSKQTEIKEGKPPRNVYSITETGREKLLEWLMIPAESQPARHEFLLKIFFSKDIPLEKVIERLQKSKALCCSLLEEYSRMGEKLLMRMGNKTEADAGLPYQYATLRYGILYIEANMKWCDETIKMFTKQNGG